MAAMIVSCLVVRFVLHVYLFSERILAWGQKEAVSEFTQGIVKDIESSDNVT